ncbi:MAG: hypothetical protein PHC64_08200 [Candidatus Gastranaerophilales bacterium]|nr:hypothetical protein [Candidatus Gastranaerophilales bacterium]
MLAISPINSYSCPKHSKKQNETSFGRKFGLPQGIIKLVNAMNLRSRPDIFVRGDGVVFNRNPVSFFTKKPFKPRDFRVNQIMLILPEGKRFILPTTGDAIVSYHNAETLPIKRGNRFVFGRRCGTLNFKSGQNQRTTIHFDMGEPYLVEKTDTSVGIKLSETRYSNGIVLDRKTFDLKTGNIVKDEEFDYKTGKPSFTTSYTYNEKGDAITTFHKYDNGYDVVFAPKYLKNGEKEGYYQDVFCADGFHFRRTDYDAQERTVRRIEHHRDGSGTIKLSPDSPHGVSIFIHPDSTFAIAAGKIQYNFDAEKNLVSYQEGGRRWVLVKNGQPYKLVKQSDLHGYREIPITDDYLKILQQEIAIAGEASKYFPELEAYNSCFKIL